ncbi:MAG: peptidoglycan-associated lipoprotein Pal [Pseudomonadota bacterium]
MLKKVMGRGVALVALATLAACASTTPDDDIAITETVVPERNAAADTRPVGAVPGSAQDLEQNVGNRVFFGYNQYNLTNEAQGVLRRQAAWLKEYPNARVRLEGHADERGTREYNLALGARRANAAKAYLTALGIDASRVTIVSYGKERPIDPRSTPEAWAQNRNSTTVLLTTVGS